MGVLWEGDRHVFRNRGHRDATLILQDMEDFRGGTRAMETEFEKLLNQAFENVARPRAIRIHIFSRNPVSYVVRWGALGTRFPPEWWT